jgi:hypothetical protein
MSIRYKVSPTSGNLNTLVAGTVTPGLAIFCGNVARKVSNLSAVVNVTAATSTLVITGKWQVSADNTTWVEVRSPNNPAYVALATGTSAATGDTVIDAPAAVYGWKWVRFVVVNTVATGGTTDLYAISYSYRQIFGAEAA